MARNVWLSVPPIEGEWCEYPVEPDVACGKDAMWQHRNTLGLYYCDKHKQEVENEQLTANKRVH